MCVCLPDCVYGQVAKAVSQALNRSVNCLPGQRDVDNAIRTVGEASKRLLADSVSSLLAQVFHPLGTSGLAVNNSPNYLLTFKK